MICNGGVGEKAWRHTWFMVRHSAYGGCRARLTHFFNYRLPKILEEAGA